MVILIVVPAALAAGLHPSGQDQLATDRARSSAASAHDSPLVDRWKREAADYRVILRTAPEVVLSLRAESALNWTNPMRIDDGVSLLWVADGRPQVFACFFRYKW